MDSKENSKAERGEGGAVAPDEQLEESHGDSERVTATGRARLVAFLNERYRSVDPRWLGIFRIGFGCLLLSELLYRWSYARLLFSNEGVLPNHFSLFAPMGQDLFSIYHAFSTLEEVHVAFALTFVVFACFTLGYRTRLFHVLSAILITSLHARNLFTENGGSVCQSTSAAKSRSACSIDSSTPSSTSSPMACMRDLKLTTAMPSPVCQQRTPSFSNTVSP